MSDQATRPSFYQELTTKLPEAVEEVSEDTQALAYITQFKGWKLLKAHSVKLEDYLDQMVSEAMASGMSVSEIGERTMVKELTKFIFRSFIAKAEDAKRSIEK